MEETLLYGGAIAALAIGLFVIFKLNSEKKTTKSLSSR